MSNLALFVLAHDQARTGAAMACTSMPEGTVVQFREPVKSREQEDKYHALIGEIAAHPPPEAVALLHGKKLSVESWKRLLIDAFKHDTATDPDLAPAVGQLRCRHRHVTIRVR